MILLFLIEHEYVFKKYTSRKFDNTLILLFFLLSQN